MLTQAMRAFIDKVANTEALHAPAARVWIEDGAEAVAAFAKEQGYEVTPGDVLAAREAAKSEKAQAFRTLEKLLDNAWKARDELRDEQLDLVAGGSAIGPLPPPDPTKG